MMALALPAMLAVQACGTADDSAREGGQPPGFNPLEGVTANIHDDFARITEQIPDFGGFYFDRDGHPTVYLLDPAPDREQNMRRVLEEVLGDDVLARGHSPRRPVNDPRLKLIQGEFAMAELLGWFERLHDVFAIDEVVFIDLDEQENELAVGVETRGAYDPVRDMLGQLDIPDTAVSITVAEPFKVRSHDLGSNFRPPLGGIAIKSPRGACSYGFTGYAGGQWGFVTNSHCTEQLGTVTDTPFSNPESGGQIGTETIDAGFWSCGFLGWRSCRHSDAAFIAHNAGIGLASEDGYPLIARTTDWAAPGEGSGPLEIDHHRPTLKLTDTRPYSLGGEMLDKMGKTTGWTWGYVDRTCITGAPELDTGERYRVDGKKVLYKCQDQATHHSAGGDSGAPVFKWQGDTVILYGLHWGSGQVFSPMANIRWDLQQ